MRTFEEANKSELNEGKVEYNLGFENTSVGQSLAIYNFCCRYVKCGDFQKFEHA